MTKTNRKNLTVKAFQTYLSKQEKADIYHATDYRQERRLIGAINNRDENLDCMQVKNYCEEYLQVLGEGATKIAYGTRHLAICFIKNNYSYCLGNQIKKQVQAWDKIALTEYAIYFNPVISYGLHRGDKLHSMDTRYLNECFIVSQKAEFFGGIRESIIATYQLNHLQYTPELITSYYNELKQAAKKFNIGDLHCNNIGVIYDYNSEKYRAVITDYGLDAIL